MHNVTVSDGAVAVTSAGADFVFGGSADDIINGGGGNDVLNGGGGTNTAVYSGIVNNYAFTLNPNGSVTVADQRAGTPDGTDTDTSIQNYQFSDGLVLTQAQLAFGVITGTPGNDVLTGSNVANAGQLILGLAGNVENLIYTGTAGINATGNASNNTFSGFDGVSKFNGGGGTDTAVFTGVFTRYTVVVNADGSITLTDTRAGSPDGTDTFTGFSSFQFSDGTVLTAAQLTAGGTTTTPINVTGTAGNDTLTSTSPGAIISGAGGADTLNAGAANQTLNGGAGADTMNDNGQSGITMLGGAGNDTYIVSNAGTVITELANNGTDTLQTSLSTYQLPANIERLVFTGSGSFTATATVAG